MRLPVKGDLIGSPKELLLRTFGDFFSSLKENTIFHVWKATRLQATLKYFVLRNKSYEFPV